MRVLLRECRGGQYTTCCREVKEERSGIEQESAKGRASLMAQWRSRRRYRRYRRHEFNPCVRKIPWRRKWQLTPIFLSG